MNWALAGGGAAAVLVVGAGGGWLVWRRKPLVIESAEAAAAAAEASLPGFRVTGAVVGADGQAGLAVSDQGRVAVCQRRGKRIAVREVAWRSVRAAPGGIVVETGDRRFGAVCVTGIDALDVRRLSPLEARELMAPA